MFAIIACLIAVVASLLRGGKYHYTAEDEAGATVPAAAPAGSEPVEPNSTADPARA
jgi:hypothetical protein